MDGSPCTGDAHSVVVNHSGYDDDEIQNLMEIGSEDDEESPPQLVFTDGSCSDTNSQHSDGIFSSPDGRSELCPSPAFQNCIPGEADENKISMDEVVSTDPKSPLDDNMEVVFSQGISGEEHKNLGSYAYSVDTESQVDPALEKNDALIAVAPCTSCSPDLDRDEVDMEVSSGDESDNCTDRAREQNSAVTFQTPEKSQPTLEEKKAN